MNSMLAIVMCLGLLPAGALAQTTTPVSASTGGVYGNAPSGAPYIVAGGRWVYFESDANNLVPGDTNGLRDIFRHDVGSGETTLISAPLGGTGPSNGASSRVDFDNYNLDRVVFQSDASNLVAGDTNGVTDVFMLELDTGVITRISVTSTGAEASAASERPRFFSEGIVFESDAPLVPSDVNGFRDVYLVDFTTGLTSLLSVTASGVQGNGPSYDASPYLWASPSRPLVLSFTSDASNLVSGDSNGVSDIFVNDTSNGAVRRVSTGLNGAQANGPSSSSEIVLRAGERYTVVYSSLASNLVAGDTNLDWDLFRATLATGFHERLNLTASGAQSSGLQVDRPASPYGNSVVFASDSPNLVVGDTNNATDVFRRDLDTGAVDRLSVADDGSQLNGPSRLGGYDPVQRNCVFLTAATNVVPGGSPGIAQLYIREGRELQAFHYCPLTPNSAGAGAKISAFGSALIPENNLTVVATDLPPYAFGMFLVSRSAGWLPNPAGSAGNICLDSADLGRFIAPGQVMNSGAAGSISISVDLTSVPSSNSPGLATTPGRFLHFQAWMRDQNAQGQPTSNFTDAVAVRFW